jgi:hypothetical protein
VTYWPTFRAGLRLADISNGWLYHGVFEIGPKTLGPNG